jgi:hypothetical protein
MKINHEITKNMKNRRKISVPFVPLWLIYLMSGHIFTIGFSYWNEMGSKKDKKGAKNAKSLKFLPFCLFYPLCLFCFHLDFLYKI